MKKLTLAYFGSPSFSANFLEKILYDKTLPLQVKLVVTQPDRPVGKKQLMTPSPVKLIAIKNNIKVAVDVASEETLREADFRNDRKSLAEEKHHERQNLLQTIDLVLVCAYGQIIPKELLLLPKYGFWNIHFSLLPKYRGASPVAYALMEGEKKTGVTILQMDEKIDHGPIIAQEEIGVFPHERRRELELKLTNLAFKMFKKQIENIGSIKLKEQDHNLATYTHLLKKDDGFIPFKTLKKALKDNPLAGRKIYNLFRGLDSWPGVWTLLHQGFGGQAKRLKITDMELVNNRLIFKKVQLEGKKEVNFNTFNRAYKIF